MLYIRCGDDSSDTASWGSGDDYWHGKVGSVLLVRSDGQPLAMRDGEALCCWCETELKWLFECAQEAEMSGKKKVSMTRYSCTGSPQAYKFDLPPPGLQTAVSSGPATLSLE